jgi:hypothetical protein
MIIKATDKVIIDDVLTVTGTSGSLPVSRSFISFESQKLIFLYFSI